MDRPPLDCSTRRWKIRLKDVKHAIRHSNNSMPGPDNIPYTAWKYSGDLAVQILFDVTDALQHDDATQLFNTSTANPDNTGHDFNLGLLVCLGKKPDSHDDTLGDIYSPGSTRPLSIVNTDNRIIANAAKHRWEPIINEWVSPAQQGFLSHRSLLKNLLDVDFATMATALRSRQWRGYLV